MPTILYYNPLSPPARAVVLLIRYLGLNDIELKQVDITPGKPRDPEYLEKNPLGQVPFLEDNGLYLSESRAIMLYLVDSRAPESSLVGRFPKKRAIIHQRFHYDLGTIGPKAAEVIRGVLFGLMSVPTEESMNQFHSKLDYIEQALAKTQWISGDNITLADLSYLANVATYVVSNDEIFVRICLSIK